MLTGLENLSKEELLAILQQHQQEAEKLEELRLQNAQLRQEHRTISREYDQMELELQRLTLLVQKLTRLAFAQKRERFEGNTDQMSLPFEMAEAEVKALGEQTVQQISYERKKGDPHAGRQALPEHLPVEEVHIHPEGDLSEMVCIGEEVTDELEYKPGSYFIRRFIRHKYAPKDKNAEGGVVIASLPARPIEKGIAGPGLLASILVDKYVDHLPLYRQLQRFKRENIPIASSTLEGWARQGMNLLDVLYQHLLKRTRAKGYLQADESPVKVQDRDKKGVCHQGYYWVYHCPLDGTVLFDYQPGRGAGAAAHVLAGFKGYLQTDGYGVYDKIGAADGVTHLGCWAHARREFHDALSNDRPRAEMALVFIQTLYAVEAQAREEGMTAEQRKSLRLDKSLKTINDFAKWMKDEFTSGRVLPKSTIGKAMAYSLERWDKLSNYLHDGTLEIDNNLIENTIRPLAIGRKNYLFAGSHEGAKRAAAIYSFFAMCKKEGVNPFEWLKYVLENIGDTKMTELHTLYPKHFAELSKV